MQNNNKQKNSGFTIVEALVAIFILTVSISALLNITASSATLARYSNNEITANYLLQEAIDSVRNSRDTIAFQQKATYGVNSWTTFLTRYNNCLGGKTCYLKLESFNPSDITGSDVVACTGDGQCPFLNYDSSTNPQVFYTYDSNGTTEKSNFNRQIKMLNISSDAVRVTATLVFKNGTAIKTQSLETILLNWQRD